MYEQANDEKSFLLGIKIFYLNPPPTLKIIIIKHLLPSLINIKHHKR